LLLEDPQPVSAQNFCDVVVTETALNQFPGEVSGMRMIRQIRNEMWRR
jgi:hypothetical protein